MPKYSLPNLLLPVLTLLFVSKLVGTEHLVGSNRISNTENHIEDIDSNTSTYDDDQMTWNTKEATAEISAKSYGYKFPQVPLDVDGYPVGPDNLQLEQVHVYVRHGVSPLTTALMGMRSFLISLQENEHQLEFV